MYPTLLEFELAPYGVLTVSTGGALMVFAFVFAGVIGVNRMGAIGVSRVTAWHAWLCCVIGGLFGARLVYGLEHAEYFPMAHLFQFVDGGFNLFGGIIGGTLCVLVLCVRERVPVLSVTDVLAGPLFIGIALGRVGNFFEGSAFGRPYAGPGSVTYPVDSLASVTFGTPDVSVIPVQLLMAGVWAVVGTVFLRMSPGVSTGTPSPSASAEAPDTSKATVSTGGPRSRQGLATVGFLIVYGMGRFCLEPLRGDNYTFAGLLSVNQCLASGTLIMGLWLRSQLKDQGRI